MRLVGDKLSSVRGGRELFKDLSFAVAGGEALVVTGPNGSGKTSLASSIASLLGAAGPRQLLATTAQNLPATRS